MSTRILMMKGLARIATSLVVSVLLFGYTYAQETTTNFYGQIRNYDLSTIITADSVLIEDRESSKDYVKRPEILGFIGENFQRFHIHFLSVIQNPSNRYEYFAYGKTMVKENVCSFQGRIVVKESTMEATEDVTDYKKGTAVCEVFLYEDEKQSSTGSIQGTLTVNFIIDRMGKLRYDAFMFVADGFSNNQFIGTWTSYKTNVSKKCNWGDYRIPESDALDSGTAEFSVSEKYVKNGWVSYVLEQRAANLNVKPEQSKNAGKRWWEQDCR